MQLQKHRQPQGGTAATKHHRRMETHDHPAPNFGPCRANPPESGIPPWSDGDGWLRGSGVPNRAMERHSEAGPNKALRTSPRRLRRSPRSCCAEPAGSSRSAGLAAIERPVPNVRAHHAGDFCHSTDGAANRYGFRNNHVALCIAITKYCRHRLYADHRDAAPVIRGSKRHWIFLNTRSAEVHLHFTPSAWSMLTTRDLTVNLTSARSSGSAMRRPHLLAASSFCCRRSRSPAAPIRWRGFRRTQKYPRHVANRYRDLLSRA